MRIQFVIFILASAALAAVIPGIAADSAPPPGELGIVLDPQDQRRVPWPASPKPSPPGSQSIIFTTHVTPGACDVICEDVPFCSEIAAFNMKTAACYLRLDIAHPAFKKLVGSCPDALKGGLKEAFMEDEIDPKTGEPVYWFIVCAR